MYKSRWDIAPETHCKCLSIETLSTGYQFKRVLDKKCLTHLVVDVHTGALTIDRLFSYVDMMSAGIILLYTLSGVTTGYLKSIELTFVNLLIQGTLETILNMGKWRVEIAQPQNLAGTLTRRHCE